MNKKEMQLVSVVLPAYNSRKYYGEKYEKIKKYLEIVLSSIKNQTYLNLEVLVFDDCSEESLRETVKSVFPEAKFTRNETNLGLLKTENRGIKESSGKYVLMANQDLKLEEDYIEKLVAAMEENNKIGVISGKTRFFFIEEDGKPNFTEMIDSAGMLFYKDRNIIERGRLEEDCSQYDSAKEMFGVTGAAPLFRKEALDDILINGEYYDEDFWMYKDDVDICWRLNLRGWECLYYPRALAYHARTAAGIAKKYRGNFILRRFGYIIHRIFKKEGGSAKVRRRDFCNHYLTLIKNDTYQSILKSIIPFGWREFQKLVFGIFFEPNVYFPGWVDFFKKLGKIKEKRKIIQSRRVISWREMEKKFEKGIW